MFFFKRLLARRRNARSARDHDKAQSVAAFPAAKSMRRRADQRRQTGRLRNSYWLAADLIQVFDTARETMGLQPREATINAILERIEHDMFLQQEFLAVTK
jgi:hypothetical protein